MIFAKLDVDEVEVCGKVDTGYCSHVMGCMIGRGGRARGELDANIQSVQTWKMRR